MLSKIVNTDGDESSLLLQVQQYPWDVDVFPITGATSMCSLPVFVGLDYHDASVRVCVLDTDGSELANANRRNDWKAIAEFAGIFSSRGNQKPSLPARSVKELTAHLAWAMYAG
jgi:hypothetical protein